MQRKKRKTTVNRLKKPPPPPSRTVEKITCLSAQEHTFTDEHLDRLINLEHFDHFIVNNLNLRLVDGDEVSANVIAEKESLTQVIHSDLVKGVYEGGLKIWECSIDLANFILKEIPIKEIESKSVLEWAAGRDFRD